MLRSLKQLGLQVSQREAEHRRDRRRRQGLYATSRGVRPRISSRSPTLTRSAPRRAFKEYTKAAKYKDFRRMLDKETNNIDAVTVSTPDHMHGTAAMWAMARGKHVYCQKPLTRTVWEASELTAGAAKYGVATQMGNQGYSNEGARQCCEIIWNGDIGDVTEVHAWTNRPGKVLDARSGCSA